MGSGLIRKERKRIGNAQEKERRRYAIQEKGSDVLGCSERK